MPNTHNQPNQTRSTKIRPGREVADIQASFQALNVALMTAKKVPMLMSDFSHLVLNDKHQEQTRAIFGLFRQELGDLANEIDAANVHRARPCNAFNPRTMTSSVSI